MSIEKYFLLSINIYFGGENKKKKIMCARVHHTLLRSAASKRFRCDRERVARRKINIASRYRVISALTQRTLPCGFAKHSRHLDQCSRVVRQDHGSRRNNVCVPMIRQISRQKFHVHPNGLLRSTEKYYDVDPEEAVGRRVILPHERACWNLELRFVIPRDSRPICQSANRRGATTRVAS